MTEELPSRRVSCGGSPPRWGRTAAVLFNFTSTCERPGVEPWAYLQDVLARLAEASESGLVRPHTEAWQAGGEDLGLRVLPQLLPAPRGAAPEAEVALRRLAGARLDP
jgi:hypothetical protein